MILDTNGSNVYDAATVNSTPHNDNEPLSRRVGMNDRVTAAQEVESESQVRVAR